MEQVASEQAGVRSIPRWPIFTGFALAAMLEIAAIYIGAYFRNVPYDELCSFLSSCFVVLTTLYFTFRAGEHIFLIPVGAAIYMVTKFVDFLGSIPIFTYVYPIGDVYFESNLVQSSMYVVAAVLLIYSTMLYIIRLREIRRRLTRSNAELETERAVLRETNQELRWTRAMLEQVIESLPVGLFWKNSEGQYQGCNRRYLELLDAGSARPEQLIGKTDGNLTRILYRESDYGPGSASGTWQIQTPGGNWHILRRAPLVNAEGGATGVLGTVEDITNERLLAESQALLSRAIEQVDSIVAIFNERGQFVYTNPALRALTGMTADQLHGKFFSTISSADFPEETLTEIVRVVTSGTSWKGRVALRRAQTGFACVDMTVSPIWRSEGSLSHFVLLGHDVTRELQLEQQLRQAQRLESIGRLAGGIAHDFNNMLQVVGGYTELMRAMLPPDFPYHHALEVCARVTDRAARLVRQLMLFGRRDQPEKPERFALSQTISDFLKLLRKVIGEHVDVRFDAQLRDDIVLGQPEQVERVVLNLCVNARDAMPEGGTITLRTTLYTPETLPVEWPAGLRANTYYCLEVADTGTGIPPEVMEHIFEPFFTTKEAGRGTGLGLSVAFSVMRQHEGAIAVKSVPGQGTTFYLLFPPAANAEGADRPDDTTDPKLLPRGTERILLVDDEAHIREWCGCVLRDHGYTVTEAVDGEDGWRLFSENPGGFDLVMTDVVMPRLNGVMLRGRIHRECPDIPVVLCSGYTPDVVGQMLSPEDTASLLRKPYSMRDLLHRIREELNSRKP